MIPDYVYDEDEIWLQRTHEYIICKAYRYHVYNIIVTAFKTIFFTEIIREALVKYYWNFGCLKRPRIPNPLRAISSSGKTVRHAVRNCCKHISFQHESEPIYRAVENLIPSVMDCNVKLFTDVPNSLLNF